MPQVEEKRLRELLTAIGGRQSNVGVNSTTTATDSFTGTAEQVLAPDVMVSCYSDDQAGTLYFDFSVNGTDWRAFPTDGFKVAAGVHEFHTAVKGPRYFRVRWVSSSAPTTLQIYTYYGTFRSPNSPLNQPYGLDSDSILTRSTIPWLDIGRGLATGISAIDKFGYNENVGSTFEPICYGGVYRTPSSAESIEFVSSSASDALNSTGMHELTIEGLDANFDLQTVTTAAHATDGTTSVAVSGTWTRVFRAYVSASGTYASVAAGSHVGTITIRVASGGATYITIPVLNSFPTGQSLVGAYTIPAGHTGFVFLKEVSVNSGKTFNYAFFIRQNADDVSSSYSALRVQDFKTGISGGAISSATSSKIPLGPLTGPCDVGFMGYSSGGGGNAAASVEFEIFLVNET